MTNPDQVPANRRTQPGPDMRELGSPGSKIFAGYLSEEDNPNLLGDRGLKTWKQMSNVPTGAALLKAIELPVRSTKHYVEPASDDPEDVEMADFIHHVLWEFGSQSFDDVIRIGVRQPLIYGFQPAEIVYDRIIGGQFAGLVGYDKIAYRSPQSRLRWNVEEVDSAGGGRIRQLISMTQLPPPTYQTIDIPRDKLLLFNNEMLGENYDGVSLFRPAYEPWYYRDNLQRIEAIGLERAYMGIPDAILPDDFTQAEFSAAQQIVTNMRTADNAGAVHPKSIELNMLFNKVDGGPMRAAIEYHDTQMLMVMLAHFIKLGTGGGGGAYSLAQPYSSSVLTPQGFVPMGELGVGDRVVDALGGVQRVKAIQERGELEVYEVHFGDGRVVECSADHRWAVTTPHWKRKGVPRGLRGQRLRLLRHGSTLAPPMAFDPLFGYGVLTAAEIKERLESAPTGPTFEVPPVHPVDYDETGSLPIDPYLLGLLLGDGSLGSVAGKAYAALLTTADPEVVAAVRELVPAARVKAKMGSNTCVDVVLSNGYGARSNPWTQGLHDLGLRGHKAWEKFIPEEYQHAPVSARVALLQGLMDADGTSANGQVIFAVTSLRLADDVERLVRGLGSTSVHRRMRPIVGPWTKRESYVVDFDCPGYEPFRLPRKLAKYQPKVCTQGNKIKRVVATGRMTRMRCISITGSSHLYLTDGFVPTHNSEDQSELFLMALNGIDNHFCETLNLWPGVPQLIGYNYLNVDPSRMPRVVHGEVGRRDLGQMGRVFMALGQWGFLTPDDATEDRLREMLELPERDATVTPEALKAIVEGVMPGTDNEGRVHQAARKPVVPATPAAKADPTQAANVAQMSEMLARKPWRRANLRDPADRVRAAASERILEFMEDHRSPGSAPELPSVRMAKQRRPYVVREFSDAKATIAKVGKEAKAGTLAPLPKGQQSSSNVISRQDQVALKHEKAFRAILSEKRKRAAKASA